jgi:two-component system cell cycle response regulator DivK
MSACILIIEDNEPNLNLVRYLLEHRGYAIVTAVDGNAGVEMAQALHPDLILCDLQMPGLDGFGVLRKLREDPALRSVVMIAVTALSMPGDRDSVLAAGFDGYLAKPIDPETFVTQVEAFLRPESRIPPRAPDT